MPPTEDGLTAYLVLRACGHKTYGEGEGAVTRPLWEELGEVLASTRPEAWEKAKADLGALETEEVRPEDWCRFKLVPVSRVREFRARGKWVLSDEVEGL